MKQIIPFTKDITFKNTIGDLVSISLDNDLQLKGEDLITGNFYVKGKYKLTKASIQEEEYSYKIPCEIAISDDYDTFDATIDIDDFYYDIIDNEVLRINIDLVIDNLVKKEIKEKEEVSVRKEEQEVKEIKKENEKTDDLNIVFNYDEERDNTPLNIITDTKKEVFNDVGNDTYTTYIVYLVNETDTIDSICNKYKINKEKVYDYNDIKDIKCGMKLVLPDVKNEQ